jgi:hypothetical protein
MLAFPNFTIKFVIQTDASSRQLGAVIMQNGRPIAFYIRKLNSAQQRYTTTERELLSIVETLREFKNILLGYEIEIWTDHKNLVHETTLMSSDRVMRWRLIIEEYGPIIKYIPGESNVVADALTMLPMNPAPEEQTHNQLQARMSQVCNKEFVNSKDIVEQCPLDVELINTRQQEELK